MKSWTTLNYFDSQKLVDVWFSAICSYVTFVKWLPEVMQLSQTNVILESIDHTYRLPEVKQLSQTNVTLESTGHTYRLPEVKQLS